MSKQNKQRMERLSLCREEVIAEETGGLYSRVQNQRHGLALLGHF
jgi:hypothetical protein